MTYECELLYTIKKGKGRKGREGKGREGKEGKARKALKLEM